MQLQHRADGEEQNERNDDEVERDGQELPVAQDRALLLGVDVVGGIDLARQRNEVVREVEPAGDRADDRHDDVSDERRDNRAKSGADDDADRKVDDIAAQREFLEFLQHGWPSRNGSAHTLHKCGLLRQWPQETKPRRSRQTHRRSDGGLRSQLSVCGRADRRASRLSILPSCSRRQLCEDSDVGAAHHASVSASSDFTWSSRIRSSNKVSRSRVEATCVLRSNFARSCSPDSGVSGQPSQVSIWPPNDRPSLSVTSRRAPQPFTASPPETRMARASVRTRESRTTWSVNTAGSSGSW